MRTAKSAPIRAWSAGPIIEMQVREEERGKKVASEQALAWSGLPAYPTEFCYNKDMKIIDQLAERSVL
jgi:hypothetical protein